MGYAKKILPHYTVEDWENWDGRWELVEGTAISMSPLPIPKHQNLTLNLAISFKTALKEAKCRKCKAYIPLDYKVSDDTIVEPDVLIVCGDIKRKYVDFPPVLVVEVLSPSTALRDRNTKYEIYEQEGINYYLIVDAEKEEIEIYKLQNGAYQLQTFSNNFTFNLAEGCEITADFSEVWD